MTPQNPRPFDPATPERAAALASAYGSALERVRALAERTAPDVRDPGTPVRLLPVTKFFPAADVEALVAAGAEAVGENREQEAAAKAAALREAGVAGPQWHHIGQLQTNKAKSVVRYATAVHSVDRTGLVDALGRAWSTALSRWEAEQGPEPAARAAGGLGCFVQVGLGDTEAPGEAARGARGGAAPEEVAALADRIAETPGLRLRGVMAVAPLGADPDAAFERLLGISRALRRDHPEADEISAGMSADLEAAIRWGSTLVRIGSAIMGPRPAPAAH